MFPDGVDNEAVSLRAMASAKLRNEANNRLQHKPKLQILFGGGNVRIGNSAVCVCVCVCLSVCLSVCLCACVFVKGTLVC